MDKKVDNYINKQQSPQKEICQQLRQIILKTMSSISEEMKWGVPVYGGGIFYIGVVKYGVNLGFSIKNLTSAELESFSGSGKTMRHLKFTKIADINEQKLVKLLKLVYAKT